MARVSQQDIADYLGLDRTTVTKILNRDPKYSASEDTKKRVFAAAEKLGYDFAKIRRPYKREYPRAVINVPAKATIILDDGKEFDSGECTVANISPGGALLIDLRFPRQVLPLTGFVISLRLDGAMQFGDLVGECEVVRMAGGSSRGGPELGVRFINLSPAERKKLQEFVEEASSSAVSGSAPRFSPELTVEGR